MPSTSAFGSRVWPIQRRPTAVEVTFFGTSMLTWIAVQPSGPSPSTRPFRFVAVGIWNTFFGYAATLFFFAITDLLRISYLFATIPAFIAAVLNAWAAQRWIVFGRENDAATTLLRFFALQLGFYAINTPLLALLVSGAGIRREIAAALLTLGNAAASYVIHGRWTFRGRRTPTGTG